MFCLHMNDTIQSNCNLINFLENYLNIDNPLSYSFWLSVVLLILVTLFKYLFSKKTQNIDWENLLLELPIDLCTIATTVVITGFISEDTLPHGIMIAFITLIVCAVSCYFRRLAIDYSYNESCSGKKYLFTFLDFILAGLWVSWVYYSIF